MNFPTDSVLSTVYSSIDCPTETEEMFNSLLFIKVSCILALADGANAQAAAALMLREFVSLVCLCHLAWDKGIGGPLVAT